MQVEAFWVFYLHVPYSLYTTEREKEGSVTLTADEADSRKVNY